MSTADLLQMVNAKGVGDATLRRLAETVRQEGVNPADILCLQRNDMAHALHTKPEIADSIAATREVARRQADELERAGIFVLWLGQDIYPRRLRAILGRAAPPLLFCKGNSKLLELPAVGFCGSRKASAKGVAATRDIAGILAHEGTCVVSGYAHGVDMAAHVSAMEAGSGTIFVLAEGILRFREKRDVKKHLTAGNHLVVSQFPPGLGWIGRNAMKRNTTIIGLSDAMVLVESGASGGTFAAGTEALKLTHPLFVVDFADPGSSAEANPHFIERGGWPIRKSQQGSPNLDRIRHAIQHPKWKNLKPERMLF